MAALDAITGSIFTVFMFVLANFINISWGVESATGT